MEQPDMSTMHLVWLIQGCFAHDQYFQFSQFSLVYFASVLSTINDTLFEEI